MRRKQEEEGMGGKEKCGKGMRRGRSEGKEGRECQEKVEEDGVQTRPPVSQRPPPAVVRLSCPCPPSLNALVQAPPSEL